LNDLAREIAREQEVLDRALARLEVLRATALEREKESLAPGVATPQGVYERDVQALAAASRRLDLDGAGEGLVFGRIDLAEGNALHIGRLGLRTAEQEPIVVDWRAPAAAPFYRATSADPLGVVRRRTISCRGPRVTGLEDELLDLDASLEGTIVGDGAFLAAVSRERGPQMRDIVATIQREQDLAVRAPDDGALVVTGGPGTGKTAVALHRVAYLMYAKREWYGRRGVLVVGPSRVFVDYIGAVLPSLGETSVRLSDLGGLPVLPRDLTLNGDDDAAAVAAKGSARMVPLLKRTIRQLSDPRRVRDVPLTRWGHRFELDAEDLVRRRAQVARAPRSHNAGRTAYVAALVDVAWRQWQDRPDAAKQEPGDEEDFGRWLRSEPTFLEEVDRAWPVLQPLQVLAALRTGEVSLAKVAGGLYDATEQVVLARSWPDRDFSAADAALLDELAALLGPVPEPERDPDDEWDELAELDALAAASEVTTFADRNRSSRRAVAQESDYRTYAHVVVDEAQDVTPMQWRMIGRRARGATWTIVGDWAQSAWAEVPEVRQAMTDVLGKARVRSAELSTNYRTSTEIADLAARVLRRIDPTAVPPDAVRATGVGPRWLRSADVLADLPAVLNDVLAQVSGTVGVVVPRALRGTVTDPRVAVVDTWQVKGLEYDACVVLAPELMVSEALTEAAGLRTVYVALTRATQRLVVLSAHDESWLD
jgi:DNA helicase IV